MQGSTNLNHHWKAAWKENNHSYKLYRHLLREIATSYITHERLTSPNSEIGDTPSFQHNYIALQMWSHGQSQHSNWKGTETCLWKGCHERRVMLEKSWKLDHTMNSYQHTKLVLLGNQKRLYNWCRCHKSWTIHSPRECRKQHSWRKNFKRNTGKPRSTYMQPDRGVKNTTQKEHHSTPRTEQNASNARENYHKWNKSNKEKSRKMELSQYI